MGKRIAGEACRLVNIAINAAAGLQKLLRTLAEWLGENPDDVTVTANVQFDNTPLTPQDILYLQQLATQGGPISDESVHMNIVRSGLSELTYEDEMEKIKTQEPRLALSGLPVDAPLDPLQQQAKDHADQRMANEQDLHDNPPPPDAKKPGAKK
jgi:hypothetical protein